MALLLQNLTSASGRLFACCSCGFSVVGADATLRDANRSAAQLADKTHGGETTPELRRRGDEQRFNQQSIYILSRPPIRERFHNELLFG